MWLDTFNRLRKQSGMSLDELCAKSGVPKGTLAKITSGVTKAPALETMRSLVYAMGYTLDDLDEDVPKIKNASSLSDEALKVAKDYSALDKYGKSMVQVVITEEKKRISEEQATEGSNIAQFYVDELLQPASAGSGEYIDDNSFTQRVLAKKPPRGTDFIIRVHGDSMEPTYNNGELLFVRETPNISVGEIGIFCRGNELYVKECGSDGLISHNPRYDEVFAFGDTDIKTVGKVLGVCSGEYLLTEH